MKVLLAGRFKHDFYERSFADSLSNYCKVVTFSWDSYLYGSFIKRYLFKITFINFFFRKLNNDLFNKICSEKPNVVFLWRPTHIYRKTYENIKKLNIFIVSYNNDDPFNKYYKFKIWHSYFYIWYQYKRNLYLHDLVLVYRNVNVKEAYQFGSKRVNILLPYFIEKNISYRNINHSFYKNDVVFIGHYENDIRDEYLEYLILNGINIKIFGPANWSKSRIIQKKIYKDSIYPVFGSDYDLYLMNAKIALCFYSSLNRDTYTRRCFEIPFLKTVLVTHRNNDISKFFTDRHDSLFFSNKVELLNVISGLLSDETYRNRIRENGYSRVINDGHSVESRAYEFYQMLCHF